MMKWATQLLVVSLLLFLSSQSALAEACAECTQAERDQLRIRTAHQMALSLNELLKELEMLARYPEAVALLLADEEQQLRHQLEDVLAAIQDGTAIQDGKKAPVPVAIPDRTPKSASKADLKDLHGLRPAYAQLADDARGIQAVAILLSQGLALTLSPGNRFRHKNQEYKLQDIRRVPGEAGAFEILLQGRDGKTEILKWQ